MHEYAMTYKRYRLIGFVLCAVTLTGRYARAEDNFDHFLLPETPPTIERLRKPSLDKPLLKKQNFVTEPEIPTPTVLLAPRFPALSPEQYPISIALSQGSFSSVGGNFVFSSRSHWQLSGESTYRQGEAPNLFAEKNIFKYSFSRFLSSRLMAGVIADFNDNKIFNQRHTLYRLFSSVQWYTDQGTRIRSRFAAARGEVTDNAANESLDGDVALLWQPVEDQSLNLSFTGQSDTAFPNFNRFFTASLRYDFSVSRDMVAEAGGSYQHGVIFPRAGYTWAMLPRMSVKVLYQPGFERPVWNDLYNADAYVKTAPDLLLPESVFSLRELFSYYWDPDGTLEVEFNQGSWRNYLYWSRVPGNSFITPRNAPDRFISGIAVNLRHQGERLSPFLRAAYLARGNLPLIPEYELGLGGDYRWRTWVVSAGYTYVSSRYIVLDAPETLGGYGNVSLAVRKDITSSIELFVSGENLLGERIETQPDFVRKTGTFKGGISVSF